MVHPAKTKSRTFRRVFKRTPSGKTKIDYVKPVPAKLRCAKCDKELMGIRRLSASKLAGAAKTSKRPNRPYAGNYCSPCSRRKIIEALK